MTQHKVTFRLIIASCLRLVVLAPFLTGVAWANGAEFFGDNDVKPDLYYYGHIKDTKGKVLDNAVITVTAKNAGLKFPFRNDSPGHFRSPDIGKAIKGLGHKIDLSQLEVVCMKKGYTQLQAVVTPGKTGDRVGVECVMQPVAPANVAAN